MPNYYPRRIQPADSLLYDAQGNLVGLRSGTSGDEAIFGLSASEVAATQALVSQAGNQPSATLTATVGTPGQVVRLSDGPDAGAILVWAIPQGSTSYTWCWWLWPQAAY